MPPAARVTDQTNHAGVLSGPGVPTVLIGGLPAAVLGDMTTCAFPPPGGPHPPGPIASGSATVWIAGKFAARFGDATGCGAQITSGLPTVQIGG